MHTAQWTEEAIQQITTENTSLATSPQLTEDNRTFDERLRATRSNLRVRTGASPTSKPRLPTRFVEKDGLPP
ncbi:hypothetical protein GCM10009601_48280 [Streptomyces thermospinosisporus]|uniref:Uncharacterized protein n=2 Tax=Streptomyces thermospinosisporus TaxID=161482 RepID=A0ABP4JUM9_9ACTN